MYETVNEMVTGLCSVFVLSFSMMFHVMFKEAVTSSSLIGLVFVLANIPGNREPPLLLPLAVATSSIWLSPMLFCISQCRHATGSSRAACPEQTWTWGLNVCIGHRACCAHGDETGNDECAQVLSRKWRTVLRRVVARSGTGGSPAHWPTSHKLLTCPGCLKSVGPEAHWRAGWRQYECTQ